MDRRRRFLTLEAMRGLAAICVVLFHGEQAFDAAAPASGYLAVDFFFLLSGFILAHAYEGKLDDGLSKIAFLRTRLIRLYPLYVLGTLSTIVLALLSMAFRHDNSLWTYARPLINLPLALCLLPNPTTDALFPLDLPTWTLLLELLANAAFAFGAWRSNAALSLTAAVASIVLVVSAATVGNLNLGWSTASFIPGLGRVFFSFPLGVLLYRIRHHLRPPAALAVAAPFVLMGLLYAAPAGSARTVFDVLFVAGASPLLLLAGASREPVGHRLRSVCMALGMMSYPLYVMHHPSLIAAIGAMERHVPAGLALTTACFAIVAGLIGVAWVTAVIDRRAASLLEARRRRATAAFDVA